MHIKNGLIFTKDCTLELLDIITEDDRIKSVTHNEKSENEVIDASGCFVIPGLTDIHFHGCIGYDFCDGNREAIKHMAEYELSNGITTICPATMTLAKDTLSGICKEAAAYKQDQQTLPADSRESMGASLVGINLEGPFISMEKKGAQNPAYIHKPDAQMLKQLQEDAKGLVKLVAIAPEEEGAMDCIRQLHNDFVFSVAHTTADYDTAKKAMDEGALHVTHLYNAMPAFTHRAPGVIGAAADSDGCDVELICDGVHIMPPVIRATFKLFGDDRVILISDSMMATGMKDGLYALGGQPVHVKGNLATLEDGTIAGSATNLMECMRCAIRFGVPVESAFRAATMNPARSIGIYDNYGSIEAGKKANLVLLDQKDLSIRDIIFEGKRINKA